ncbi:MAG TPA: 4-hydroxyphenylacetate 3-hydroxylase N-terminal domain-containing protein [Burkholderiaceae bacterium]|nr:4-hydroxyphenylacetate 3-hydroxylase N-terminal domain-containing protein [Burkholderiaceae bacterium]
MKLRNGRSYIESLRDGREVYINGERVVDVTTHPAFRQTIRSFAALYDYQADEKNRELMTIVSPTSGGRVSRAWELPTNLESLVRRREALTALARLHHGFLGRAPDHLATTLSAMLMGIEVFRRNGADRAKAFEAYFEYVRDNDLFVTYVIQNPQADKTVTASGQARDLVARIVAQDEHGITVQGAKMLGTSAVMADELLVANIQPLQPGEERYAFSCALPVATKGLRFLSRRSYEESATSEFDYPLSSTLDENDAIVYFDQVKVPWERVFLIGDIAAVRQQWSETPAHVYQNYQSQIRLMVKLQFLAGVARRVAETTSAINIPQVKAALSNLAAQATLVECMVYGMEAAAVSLGPYVVPPAHLLYAAQIYSQDIYPKFLQSIRELAGGGLIMSPSSVKDFAHSELARMIDETQVSSVTDSVGRVKIFKLAWDAIGSEFGSRHLQYEMFYGGAAYVNQANMFRTFDWEAALGEVDRRLDRMGAPDRSSQPTAVPFGEAVLHG